MSYAEVAVNSPAAQRRTFSYAVPPHLTVSPGQAVWVPFGSKVLQGLVCELTEAPRVEKTREIAAVIDLCPLLTPVQVALARWMSQRYLAPLFDCLALMLPPGFERRLITLVRLAAPPSELPFASLSPEQRQLLHLLQRRGKIALREVERALGKRKAGEVVAQLVRRGLVTRSQELEKPRVKPRMVSQVCLAVDAETAEQEARRLEQKAPRQAALLRRLAETPQLLLSQMAQPSRPPAEVVAALQKKGLLRVEPVQLSRDPLRHYTFPVTSPPILTPAQQAVCQKIRAALEGAAEGRPAVFLLHGVTGSGKTEVYLRALEEVISRGKRGIVLVPEIALTPQTVERFASRFPQRVTVFHSRLSVGEQFDQWQRIREGAFDVVIGSRGALFVPQPDLGLIVIDEEHEWTYKQQEHSPRYHAREVALHLAELSGAVVILGSATPDVESFYHARRGKYSLLELPQRITLQGESPLPRVRVVDLRQELKAGNTGLFSRCLAQAIYDALSAGEQVILFLNRRGAAPFVQCRGCGFVWRCQRCDLPFTYHAVEGELICHQCNRRKKLSGLCPNCGKEKIRYLGIGTQKVEQETARAFPGAKLLRWDRDVTAGRYSHERILEKFRNREADILIGTQMIAKGLDFPSVTLVGVILADIGLHLPDFRAAERAFQILSQVAGRAGRGAGGGQVIIQTYTPEHYAIVAAAKQDYTAFYQQELQHRQSYGNPPFSRLIRLLYTDTNPVRCQRETNKMYLRLREEIMAKGIPDISLLGPSPAFHSRIRGKFRWHLIVRGTDPLRLLAELPLPPGWTVDVDPVTLL